MNRRLLLVAALVAAAAAGGAASGLVWRPAAPPVAALPDDSFPPVCDTAAGEAAWGIQILFVGFTDDRAAIRLRYRVIDAVRAARFHEGVAKAALVDPRKALRLALSGPPPERPALGQVNDLVFDNQDGAITTRRRVTLEAGGFKRVNLVVR